MYISVDATSQCEDADVHKLLSERALYSAKHLTREKEKKRNSPVKNPLVLFLPVTFDFCLLLSTKMKNLNTTRAFNNPAPPKL